MAEAGDRVIVPFINGRPESPRLDRMTSAELEGALAWRGKRAEFSGTPLVEAVALFNEQNRLQLAVADTSVGALRVSGIYWADNPEGFARLIETTFGLRAVRVADDRIELRQ
jgi:transmembrane sensor